MRQIIKLLFLLLLISCSKEKDFSITLHLDGKNYDQLYMICNIFGEENSKRIDGIKRNNNTWEFPITDSVFNYTRHYTLYYASIDTADGKSDFGTRYEINFMALHNGDTIKHSQMTMDKNMMEYNGQYKSHETFNYIQGEYLLSIWEFDNFLISYKENTEFAILGDALDYSIFYDSKAKKPLSYEEGVNEYLEMTKKYPDSRYLISRLSGFKSSFKTKEDLLNIYNAFSEDNRNSVFGQDILNHINTYMSLVDFQNTSLPAWDTEESEEIVQDLSKNTLIVFSASWCAPCRAQIPLLKEIYSDLKDKLNIVYVSMDERETTDAWKEEMKSQKIPWRSVLAADNLKEISKKYYVNAGIPHTLLYRAIDGKVEVLDVRSEEHKQKLYELVNN